MKERTKLLIMCGILAVSTISFTIAAVLIDKREYKTGIVAYLGGCDKFGTCGVVLEDGTNCLADYPIIGQSTKCMLRDK